MSIYMVGGGSGDVPFNRAFFNVTLGDLVPKDPRAGESRVRLFLVDGTTLDVCTIEQLADTYVGMKAYLQNEDACSTSLQLVPYGAIYRVEVTSPSSEESQRMGFHRGRRKERGTVTGHRRRS